MAVPDGSNWLADAATMRMRAQVWPAAYTQLLLCSLSVLWKMKLKVKRTSCGGDCVVHHFHWLLSPVRNCAAQCAGRWVGLGRLVRFGFFSFSVVLVGVVDDGDFALSRCLVTFRKYRLCLCGGSRV